MLLFIALVFVFAIVAQANNSDLGGARFGVKGKTYDIHGFNAEGVDIFGYDSKGVLVVPAIPGEGKNNEEGELEETEETDATESTTVTTVSASGLNGGFGDYDNDDDENEKESKKKKKKDHKKKYDEEKKKKKKKKKSKKYVYATPTPTINWSPYYLPYESTAVYLPAVFATAVYPIATRIHTDNVMYTVPINTINPYPDPTELINNCYGGMITFEATKDATDIFNVNMYMAQVSYLAQAPVDAFQIITWEYASGRKTTNINALTCSKTVYDSMYAVTEGGVNYSFCLTKFPQIDHGGITVSLNFTGVQGMEKPKYVNFGIVCG